MWRTSSCVSGANSTTSSMRLRNSGRDVLHVQSLRNRPRRVAGCELGKDSPRDRGIDLVDPASAVDRLAAAVILTHEVVTEAQSAAGSPFPHPTLETAVDFLGEVLQEQRIHRALEAYMQFA